MRIFSAAHPRLVECLAGLTLVSIIALVIIGLDFVPADGDSRFYTSVAQQLADAPLLLKIAPQWNGHQGIPEGHYIQDHLVGLPLAAALVAELGVDAGHALVILNFILMLTSFFIIYQLFRLSNNRVHSWIIVSALLLIPISFIYRLRATHEPAVLFFTVVAVAACLLGVRRQAHFLLGLPFAVAGLFLVKGLMAVFLFPVTLSVCVYICWRDRLGWRNTLLAWTGAMAAATLLTAVIGFGYETWYRAATGKDFFSTYWQLQIVARSLELQSDLPFPVNKLGNLLFYAGCLLWYSFPFSLAFLATKWTRPRKQRLSSIQAILLIAGLVWVMTASLSDRISLRYIFPAYFLCGAAFASFLIDQNAAVQAALRKFPKRWAGVVFLLLWGLLTLAYLLFHS